MARPIDGTWSKFVWNLGEKSESLARKFHEGKACLIDLRLAVEAQPTLTQPISREQIEKTWLGEWKTFDERFHFCKCTRCGKIQEYKTNFCKDCGAPMTNETVQMVIERLGLLLK